MYEGELPRTSKVVEDLADRDATLAAILDWLRSNEKLGRMPTDGTLDGVKARIEATLGQCPHDCDKRGQICDPDNCEHWIEERCSGSVQEIDDEGYGVVEYLRIKYRMARQHEKSLIRDVGKLRREFKELHEAAKIGLGHIESEREAEEIHAHEGNEDAARHADELTAVAESIRATLRQTKEML